MDSKAPNTDLYCNLCEKKFSSVCMLSNDESAMMSFINNVRNHFQDNHGMDKQKAEFEIMYKPHLDTLIQNQKSQEDIEKIKLCNQLLDSKCGYCKEKDQVILSRHVHSCKHDLIDVDREKIIDENQQLKESLITLTDENQKLRITNDKLEIEIRGIVEND